MSNRAWILIAVSAGLAILVTWSWAHELAKIAYIENRGKGTPSDDAGVMRVMLNRVRTERLAPRVIASSTGWASGYGQRDDDGDGINNYLDVAEDASDGQAMRIDGAYFGRLMTAVATLAGLAGRDARSADGRDAWHFIHPSGRSSATPPGWLIAPWTRDGWLVYSDGGRGDTISPWPLLKVG